ncbi:N-acetylmuramoyl-L-alanine amidase [Rhodovibrio salinarum]|nr:N-acetylmuramoyl-L-alanine amidase [Rhodovibrio salinarum]
MAKRLGHRLAGLLVLLVLAGLAAPQSAQADDPTVSAVRLGQHPDKTRFVMELSTAAPYEVFTLSNPYRVVIDLPQVDWQIPENKMGEADVGLVRALRFGLFSPTTSRVVLDAKTPVAIDKVFRLSPREGYPYRLVVDMKRVSQTRFASLSDRRITSEEPLPKPDPQQRAPEPDRGDKRPTIVLDAGHGGVDPGAIGVSGTHEKDIVLDYAKHLRELLESTGRYRVVLTRQRDIFLRLRERIKLAQEAEGDLFISLHANTHNSGKIRGASVYTLSENASDKEAAQLAAKENKSDIIAGVNLGGQTKVVSQILIDLAQRETMNESKHFANVLVDELGQSVKLLGNTHRYAGFAVLKSPNIPSVLVEIGYMTNRQEEQQLLTASHRRKVNQEILDAVDSFFEWQEARRLR